MKLDTPQVNELLKAIEQLWSDGHIVVQNEEEGVSVFTYRPAIELIKIKGIEQDKLRTFISDFITTVEFLLRKSEKGKIDPLKVGLTKTDATELEKLFNVISTLKILPEIDYKMHSNTPTIDISSLSYNTKSYYPAHSSKECVTSSIGFSFSGEKKNIHFEVTRTDINELIKVLGDCKKEMDNIQETLDKKVVNKSE